MGAAVLNLMGVILLVSGLIAAWMTARARPGVPGAGFYPDTTGARYWDGRAWTRHVRASPELAAASRGRLFRGRFWGPWIWWLAAALIVLVAGSTVYSSGATIHVMAGTSMLAMTGMCVAFYRFAARQLAFDDVIGARELGSVALATTGAVMVFAANANEAIIQAAGIRAATTTVGFVEEGTKLLVPLGLYLAGRYRDPRAGIAIGLACGFAFAIVETTQYAYATAAASGPALCGGLAPAPGVEYVIQAQVYRMFLVSPLHWLWTGTATAVAWRLWHLRGSKGTAGAIGGVILVMVIHSANDTSATLGCHDAEVAWLAQLGRWLLVIGMYLLFRAMARKSTPPQLIGAVSRGWTPRSPRAHTR